MLPASQALFQSAPVLAPVPPGRTYQLPEGMRLNVAVAVRTAFRVTTHVPVPEHAPDQPANAEPDAAAVVKVTTVPEENEALQVEPQEIPAGELVTVPVPVPLETTVRERYVVVDPDDSNAPIDHDAPPAPRMLPDGSTLS